MTWFPWGRKKKTFDFNAILVSQAKQQKQNETSLNYHQDLGLSSSKKISPRKTNKKGDITDFTANGSSAFATSLRRASARAQSIAKTNFLQQPKSFSVVLTKEDLKGLELQRKLETLRKEGQQTKKLQEEEMDRMKIELGKGKADLMERLREGIDWSEYLDIAQNEIAAMETEQKQLEREEEEGDDEEGAGSNTGSTSSVQGRQEADLMKAMHKVHLQDTTRRRLQEFTNDEVMRFYKLESTIKEDFADREAKILCDIARIDAHVRRARALHEQRLDVSKRMNKRYEAAAELHIERVYQALRRTDGEGKHNCNEIDANKDAKDEDGDEDQGGLIVRRRMSLKQSYSSRILAVNAQEKEDIRKLKEERSKRMSRTTTMEEDTGEGEGVENDDPANSTGEGGSSDKGVALRADAWESAEQRGQNESSPDTQSLAYSRNTLVGASVQGAKYTGPPTRHGSSGSSAALRASAVVAARARVASRLAGRIGGKSSPRATAIKRPDGSSPRVASMKSANSGRSNIAPRRVATAVDQK